MLPAMSSWMSSASGKFFQYFIGISACMAFTLSPRRIEDAPVIGAPQPIQRICTGRGNAGDSRREL